MTRNIRDTGRARLPALPPVNAQDPSLRNWISAVNERLEVREGSRGNPYERAVTLRELETAGLVQIAPTGKSDPTASIPVGNGLSASVHIDKFVELIRNTRLYRDIMKRLDDPSRFDHLADEVRSILLRSIADEALARGADIQRTELKIQETNRSLALVVSEITAALQGNAAGIRELSQTYATDKEATAAKVTQLESSLGNFYQDGAPGRAQLEQELTTQASYVNGLRGQYTLKIQAGGALAGIGLAASEVNGQPDSAFIVSAAKFAVVSPDYSGGLTTSPSQDHIPFGVDSSGIYLNSNVYVRGQMRVDTGGKTLADGLRGSLLVAASGTYWSDSTARQAIWSALGKSGSASTNNHLVIGDQVTISGSGYAETRYWTGSAWGAPGAVINGNLLVSGSVSADKIDTRGLTIKDAYGNIIFGSGTGLPASYVSGLGSLATQNSVSSNQVSGLGSLATQSSVSTSQVSGLGSLATQSSVSTNQVSGLGSLATKDSISYPEVAGTKPPSDATNGATFGVNISGKIQTYNASTYIASLAVDRLLVGSPTNVQNGSAYMSAGNTGDITIYHGTGRLVMPFIFWNSPAGAIHGVVLTYMDTSQFRFRMYQYNSDGLNTGWVSFQYMYF